MKEKLKNYFNKDRIFVYICCLLIIAFCVLYAILYTNDKKQVSENESTIILNEDENNFNKSWSINEQGNLVGNNLFNVNEAVVGDLGSNGNVNPNSTAWWSSGFIFVEPNKTYAFSGADNYIYYYDTNKNFIDVEFGLSNYLIPSNCFYVRINGLEASKPKTDVMFNIGSTPLPWEPYGVWYSESNYDNLETQLDITLGNINPLSVNNISSNTLVLNSVDVTNQLGGSIFLSDLNGGLGFYNYDFDAYSSFNDNGVNEFNLISFFNRTYSIYGISAFVSLSHIQEDYLDISIYRDNQLILVMNDLDSETTQEYMQQYGNQEIQFNKIVMSGKYTSGADGSNRYGTNYIVDNNNYAFGYQQGYKDSSMYYDAENTRLVGENAQLNNDLTNLDSQYTTLNNNYNSLLEQYNLLNNDKYTFTELFWSISAVPFGVLTSAFNVNVLGFNLAAIITGLFTSLLLIWLIKKFFK